MDEIRTLSIIRMSATLDEVGSQWTVDGRDTDNVHSTYVSNSGRGRGTVSCDGRRRDTVSNATVYN